jgi:hypothetical protein
MGDISVFCDNKDCMHNHFFQGRQVCRLDYLTRHREIGKNVYICPKKQKQPC